MPSYLDPCPGLCFAKIEADIRMDAASLTGYFCGEEDLECISAAAEANHAAYLASKEAEENYCDKDCDVPACGGPCPADPPNS